MERLARACRGAAWLPVAALLVSCGGGDRSEDRSGPPSAQRSGDASAGGAKRMRIAEFVPPNPIPPTANVDGMWSPVYPWPLISVHSALLPDGRVMTYGSDLTGLQTGHSKYDIWDSTGAPDAGHLTLDNPTGTDIFCSSQVLLPQSGNLFIAGGDVWTGTQTTNKPEQQQQPVRQRQHVADPRDQHEPRALVLEFDHAGQRRNLHPGRFRRERPSRNPRPRRFVPPDERDQHQRARELSTRATSSRPTARSSVTPPPTVRCTGSTRPAAARSRCSAFSTPRTAAAGTRAPRCTGPAESCRSAAPRTAPTRSTSPAPARSWRRRRRCRAREPGSTRRSSPTARSSRPAAAPCRAPRPATTTSRRPGTPPPGSGTRARSRKRCACTTRTRCCLPDGSVLVSGGGAISPTGTTDPNKNNLNAEIYYPPYLFTSTEPRHQRARRAADRRQRADLDRHRQDLRPGCHRQRGERQPHHAGQDRLDVAQLQHGPALPRPDVQRERVARRRAGADARRRSAARVLPAVRVQRSRRAVGRQDRPHGHRDRPEPRRRSGAHEPGRTGQHRRRRRRPRAERQRPERRRAELRRDRPAAGPGDRCEQWPHHRHRDDRGQLQRRRLGDRRHQQRDRRVRLDGAGGDAADPRKPAGAGLRRHQRRRELQRERERQRPAVQVELRRRHPGYRLVDLPVRHAHVREPGHLRRHRLRQG